MRRFADRMQPDEQMLKILRGLIAIETVLAHRVTEMNALVSRAFHKMEILFNVYDLRTLLLDLVDIGLGVDSYDELEKQHSVRVLSAEARVRDLAAAVTAAIPKGLEASATAQLDALCSVLRDDGFSGATDRCVGISN